MGTRDRPDLHGVERFMTPTDNVEFPLCNAVIVDVDGVLECTDRFGNKTTVPLSGKMWHPMRIVKVHAAGTTGITISAMRVGYHDQ